MAAIISDENRDNCKEELQRVWDRYGIWTLLQSFADIIDEDTALLKECHGEYASEVAAKEKMTALIRQAAGSPVE